MESVILIYIGGTSHGAQVSKSTHLLIYLGKYFVRNLNDHEQFIEVVPEVQEV